jgi:hypothetical protein
MWYIDYKGERIEIDSATGERMPVPATPQPSAPVVACKAPEWCGFKDGDASDPRRSDYMNDDSHNYGEFVGGRYFCSAECVPPLAAQPAEACSCPHGQHTTDGKCSIHRTGGIVSRGFAGCECAKCKPAEQPKPAKGPVCTNGSDCPTPTAHVLERVLREERQFMCDRCYLLGESFLMGGNSTRVLRDPAIPGRIATPPMAHIAGMHDDDLIGGAR